MNIIKVNNKIILIKKEKVMSKENVVLIVAKGASTNAANVMRRFKGIAAVSVLAVNPNKEALEKFYSTENNSVTLEKEPTYYNVDDGIQTARINFLVQIDPNLVEGQDIKFSVSYFLKNQIKYNKDSTKVQLINAFGETAWVSVEDAKTGKLPDNMKWFDTTGARPALIGEEDLVRFIKALCGIPNKSYSKDGKVITIPDVTQAYCQLDDIKKYFNGNIDELTSVVEAWKDKNKIKLLLGAKVTADNRVFQDVFIQMPLKFSTRNFNPLFKEVASNKDSGRYPNTDFGVEPYPFMEHSLESTSFDTSETTKDEVAPTSWWN